MKSINNITELYYDRLGPKELEIVQSCQSEFLRKTSELVHKGYIPLSNLFDIYEHSARISDRTGFVPKPLVQLNALTQILDSCIKLFFKNSPPKLYLLSTKEVEASYVSAIYKVSHNQFFAQNASAILKFISLMPNENQKKFYLKEMISFIGQNNVRQLQPQGIIDLLEVMDKYELRNKQVLLNILPNLPTLIDESLKKVMTISTDELVDKIDNFYKNKSIYLYDTKESEQETKLRHLVFKQYELLFENFRQDFEQYPNNLEGFSLLIAPIFKDLSKPQLLVRS